LRLWRAVFTKLHCGLATSASKQPEVRAPRRFAFQPSDEIVAQIGEDSGCPASAELRCAESLVSSAPPPHIGVMHVPLVMTVIGPDRTGLVESLARLVAEHDGNWLESRMCRLGGEFAGILRVQLPVARRAAFEQALARLADLSVVVRADEPPTTAAQPQVASLEVIGPDRPGIVREISHALAAQGVNVEELTTECSSAPMSGEALFQARAKLRLPDGVTLAALRQSLEHAAAEIGVEFTLMPA
jgi:glycine cleavage system regulatory protein